MTTNSTIASPRRRTGWVLPVALLLVMFGVPAVQGGVIIGGQEVPALIKGVLSHPWSESVPALLPVARFVLFAVAFVGILGTSRYPQIVLGYYAIILVVVAVFQNTATLPRGVTVILGNTAAQLVVAMVCFLGLRRTNAAASLHRERLWLIPLMLWAWIYPFVVDRGIVVAGGWSEVFKNGVGVTYCMITPVIAGTMALRPAAYARTTRATVGWLGAIFGLLNMMTWFVLDPASWWMGILHIPLFVNAGFLAITSWREPRL